MLAAWRVGLLSPLPLAFVIFLLALGSAADLHTVHPHHERRFVDVQPRSTLEARAPTTTIYRTATRTTTRWSTSTRVTTTTRYAGTATQTVFSTRTSTSTRTVPTTVTSTTTSTRTVSTCTVPTTIVRRAPGTSTVYRTSTRTSTRYSTTTRTSTSIKLAGTTTKTITSTRTTMSTRTVPSTVVSTKTETATRTVNTCTPPPVPTLWTVSDTFVGNDFFGGFDFIDIDDPTSGRVNYVNYTTAVARNLTWATSDTFGMRADSWSTVPSSARGRDSVRIQSKRAWTNYVSVIDVRHMPQGCGTWPAYWSYGDPWPTLGEIDVIEGINDVGRNLMSLHTTSGCTQPSSGRNMTGTPEDLNCNWEVNYNSGCNVRSPSTKSFGPSFNAAGGGWYAVEKTSTSIKIWFCTRSDGAVPAEIKNGLPVVDTAGWGKPTALFVDNSCSIASKFGPNKILINLTFCGAWAGNDFQCASGTCNNYVNNHPEAFVNAYWDIASLRVYQQTI